MLNIFIAKPTPISTGSKHTIKVHTINNFVWLDSLYFPLLQWGYTVCPQSPFGVLKNCGAQTNWTSHMRFAADYSETLEVFFTANGWNKRPSLRFSVSCLWNGECAGRRALCGMAFWDKISYPDSTKGSPQRGLLRSVKNFQSFVVICRKPHVASSICLRATICQNPEGTLWTHCIFEPDNSLAEFHVL
jgi:hypothetical protein